MGESWTVATHSLPIADFAVQLPHRQGAVVREDGGGGGDVDGKPVPSAR